MSLYTKKLFRNYQDIGDLLENANRATLFDQKYNSEGNLLPAAYSARDIMDFSLSGSSQMVRFMTSITPFANAKLQGMYKMGRSAKQYPNAFYPMVLMVMGASLLNYLMYRDDEDWKAREEWDKDTYWWVKIPGADAAFRIPLPHDFGVPATVAWRGLQSFMDEDNIHGAQFTERLTKVLHTTFSLNPIPQIISPAIEAFGTNVDAFTGRPVEDIGMQRLSPEERRRMSTSTTAVGVSRGLSILPDSLQPSPVQIDHLVEGYLGWFGETALYFSDLIAEYSLGLSKSPGSKLSEYPVARTFIQQTPIRNTTYGTKFYQQLKDLEQVYADVQLNKRIGEYKRAMDLERNNAVKLAYRKLYTQKRRIVQDLSNRMKVIRNSKYMSAEMKRSQIERLEYMRSSILRNVVESYGRVVARAS